MGAGRRRFRAGDVSAVRKVIRGCDIVFEPIFAKYNIPVMKACLAEGCWYSDLFGSPAAGNGVSEDETIGAQLALDEEFKKKAATEGLKIPTAAGLHMPVEVGDYVARDTENNIYVLQAYIVDAFFKDRF